MENVKERLCFSTLGCCDRSLDTILKICTQYSIKYLEIRGINSVLDNLKIPEFTDENIEKTKGLFANYGVKPLVLGTSCAFHDPIKLNAAIDEGRASLCIAEKIGAKAIRVFGNRLSGDARECTGRVVSALKTLCDEAEECGVDVLLEVHGDYNTSESLQPICSALREEKRFGLIWDIGHTTQYGNRQMEFYREFAPFIRHMHLKDEKNGILTLPGDGAIDIKGIVNAAADEGYEGMFSLEWEKKWHPELPDLETALDALKKVLE